MIKTLYDYRGDSDVKYCIYLSFREDDIFRTLERIESNQPYYTTLIPIALLTDQHTMVTDWQKTLISKLISKLISELIS